VVPDDGEMLVTIGGVAAVVETVGTVVVTGTVVALVVAMVMGIAVGTVVGIVVATVALPSAAAGKVIHPMITIVRQKTRKKVLRVIHFSASDTCVSHCPGGVLPEGVFLPFMAAFCPLPCHVPFLTPLAGIPSAALSWSAVIVVPDAADNWAAAVVRLKCAPWAGVRAEVRSLSDIPRVCAAAASRVSFVRKFPPVCW
jgi:hypothetical protein